MKLYMNPLSPNVRRVRITAAALELPLQEITLDFAKGEHKRPDYLALNPNGAVPTLVDGELVLTESRAIMQYLASKKPEACLLPSDEPARADVVRWQFWDAAHFSPPLGALTFEKIIKPLMGLGEPSQDKIDEASANLRRFGAVLDERLRGQRYLVGDSLTVADLTVASSLMYAKQTNAPLTDFANLQAWFSRISDTAAWRLTEPR
ncbi:MAG TPA: glutathione S-transferase family protein [Polyangiaceae bacterium]|nr:glutathione S-transferase family protein [Polyangiaceae bacterium]